MNARIAKTATHLRLAEARLAIAHDVPNDRLKEVLRKVCDMVLEEAPAGWGLVAIFANPTCYHGLIDVGAGAGYSLLCDVDLLIGREARVEGMVGAALGYRWKMQSLEVERG